METNYFVKKITYVYKWCRFCDGSGQKSKRYKNEKFVEHCRMCKGTGKEKIGKITEVSLAEALKELNLIK